MRNKFIKKESNSWLRADGVYHYTTTMSKEWWKQNMQNVCGVKVTKYEPIEFVKNFTIVSCFIESAHCLSLAHRPQHSPGRPGRPDGPLRQLELRGGPQADGGPLRERSEIR